MGRPTSYNPEIAHRICEELAVCGSLRKVCAMEGMPSRVTVTAWLVANHDDFFAKYARAKSTGIANFVDETLEIADETAHDWVQTDTGPRLDTEAVARSKIRIETRRWLAERMEPQKYGLKQGIDLTSSDGTMTPLDETARSARVAQLLASAAARKAGADDYSDLA